MTQSYSLKTIEDAIEGILNNETSNIIGNFRLARQLRENKSTLIRIDYKEESYKLVTTRIPKWKHLIAELVFESLQKDMSFAKTKEFFRTRFFEEKLKNGTLTKEIEEKTLKIQHQSLDESTKLEEYSYNELDELKKDFSEKELDNIKLYWNSIVMIYTPTQMGTGFLISKRKNGRYWVMTNCHVISQIKNKEEIRVLFQYNEKGEHFGVSVVNIPYWSLQTTRTNPYMNKNQLDFVILETEKVDYDLETFSLTEPPEIQSLYQSERFQSERVILFTVSYSSILQKKLQFYEFDISSLNESFSHTHKFSLKNGCSGSPIFLYLKNVSGISSYVWFMHCQSNCGTSFSLILKSIENKVPDEEHLFYEKLKDLAADENPNNQYAQISNQKFDYVSFECAKINHKPPRKKLFALEEDDLHLLMKNLSVITSNKMNKKILLKESPETPTFAESEQSHILSPEDQLFQESRKECLEEIFKKWEYRGFEHLNSLNEFLKKLSLEHLMHQNADYWIDRFLLAKHHEILGTRWLDSENFVNEAEKFYRAVGWKQERFLPLIHSKQFEQQNFLYWMGCYFLPVYLSPKASNLVDIILKNPSSLHGSNIQKYIETKSSFKFDFISEDDANELAIKTKKKDIINAQALDFYHTTDAESAVNIIENGIRVKGRPMQDFSDSNGFYLNTDFSTALEWRLELDIKMILVFTLNLKTYDQLGGFVFSGDDQDWENCIRCHRLGDECEQLNWNDYPFLRGPQCSNTRAIQRDPKTDLETHSPPQDQLCIRKIQCARIFHQNISKCYIISKKIDFQHTILPLSFNTNFQQSHPNNQKNPFPSKSTSKPNNSQFNLNLNIKTNNSNSNIINNNENNNNNFTNSSKIINCNNIDLNNNNNYSNYNSNSNINIVPIKSNLSMYPPISFKQTGLNTNFQQPNTNTQKNPFPSKSTSKPNNSQFNLTKINNSNNNNSSDNNNNNNFTNKLINYNNNNNNNNNISTNLNNSNNNNNSNSNDNSNNNNNKGQVIEKKEVSMTETPDENKEKAKTPSYAQIVSGSSTEKGISRINPLKEEEPPENKKFYTRRPKNKDKR